jgi:hypothetical protein
MKEKFSILIFTLFLMLLFGSFEQTFACSCFWESPCQKYADAEIVFAGKVVEIKPKEENLYFVVFELSEAFKGLKDINRVEILSSQNGGGDCSFRFELNEEYLIHSKRNREGYFYSHLCMGIQTLKYADESITIYRSFTDPDNQPFIFGKIRDVSEKYKRLESLKDIRIQAQETGRRKRIFYGTTNENGFFQIKVPSGRYAVTPLLPENFIFSIRGTEKDMTVS